MDQLRHTDPGFTLRVYRHGMRRDGAAKGRLKALVGVAEWAAMSSSEARMSGQTWRRATGGASTPLVTGPGEEASRARRRGTAWRLLKAGRSDVCEYSV